MSDATPRKPDTKDGVYFDDPALPEGWTRKCVQRSTGDSAGKWDVYVYNPMGKKFRSQNEVRRYLEQINSDISPLLFCFNAHATAGMPSARRRTPAVVNTKPKAKPKPAATKILSKARGRPKKVTKNDSSDDAPSRKLKLKFNFTKKRGPGRVATNAAAPKAAKKGTRRAGRPRKHSEPEQPQHQLVLQPKEPEEAEKPKVEPEPAPQRPQAPPQRTQQQIRQQRLKRAQKLQKQAKPQKALKPLKSQKPLNERWVPPESPYDLVQERYHADPWKLLVSCIFLSKSSEGCPDDTWGDPPPVVENRLARPLLEKFFERWPTAKAARGAERPDVLELIAPLQLGDEAAATIIQFSDEFVNKKYKSPTELHGVDRIGDDSYRLFCLGQWKHVRPQNYLLNIYHNWIWTNHKALRLQ